MFKQHPKGLYILFFTEMWERFSYYGMRAILSLYMINALLYDKAFTSSIYGYYTGLVYLTPLLGGYIADRYWGNRKSIIIGAIVMSLGQFALSFSGFLYVPPVDPNVLSSTLTLNLQQISFVIGLTLLIIGNGFFKPNISTMVGSLYPAESIKLRDSAFTIFYMGINLGALFSPLVAGGLGDTGNPADFKWGFLSAGVGMLIGLITFVWGKSKYLVTPEGEQVGLAPSKESIEKRKSETPSFSANQLIFSVGLFIVLNIIFILLGADYISSLIFSSMIAIPALIIVDKSLTKIEKQRIAVIYILVFFVIFFWAAFEQAGVSLTFFAEEQTNRVVSWLGNYVIPASFFQTINPIAILIFAPVFAALWTKLDSKGKEPSSPLKMAIGLFLLSLGFVMLVMGARIADTGVKVSPLWLVGAYTLHTFGELSLSPIGLSMVTKLSPLKFSSLLMGVWFLANAAANLLAGKLSTLYPESGRATSILGFSINNLGDFFTIFIVMSLAASIILFLIYRKLLKMMNGVS